jgi:hypothetical protein
MKKIKQGFQFNRNEYFLIIILEFEVGCCVVGCLVAFCLFACFFILILAVSKIFRVVSILLSFFLAFAFSLFSI